MKLSLEIDNKTIQIDTEQSFDLSIHVNDKKGPLAWYVDPIKIEPVVMGGFIGSVKQGSPVNFMNVAFNPHGNITHTETIAHISELEISVNDIDLPVFMRAQVVTIQSSLVQEDNGVHKKGDLIILPDQINEKDLLSCDAVIIRTLPNTKDKITQVYSGSNPTYLHIDTVHKLLEVGITHILIDLPSLDREEDKGLLECHKAFWNYPANPQTHRTITELCYIENEIPDGPYMLNLQVAPFDMDASPSRPVIFPIL